MTINGITITQETILATRQWYADNAMACIKAATAGEYRVNDLPRYVTQQYRRAADSLAGDNDHTLSFAQRALYIQTGECVAMLG